MTDHSTDILISGGGVAGLTAAAAFGSAGFSVLCVDPAPPVTEETADGADLRTTAFLQPSLKVLKDAGLWDRLAPFATDLQVMRIVDAGGKTPAPRVTRDFNARDVSDLPFGWNLPNWLLRREILARLKELPNVTFRPGTGTASVLTRDVEARVTLSDGTRVRAKLLIAADGRNSPVREAVDIGAKTIRYGQKALAFAVTHPEPHNNVSTEIHRSGGPFTLVPLPDRDGRPCSAIVWMERGPEVLRLAALPEADFNAEMTARSGALYGPLKLETRRTVWPIISQIAHRMWAERTALIAEAAHVVPPIGAQGLNMSLADIRVLLELSRAAPADIGNDRMLDLYHRRRHPEVAARVAGIDILNRTSMRGERIARDLRAAGIAGLYGLPPVRKTLMRAGMGVRLSA
ncbi:UbiH/UbiF family hydroxylase [Rhodovulum adriaticum]|uniref:2-octaprenyl-6-methoxyphenol hydroxylase n=1 Tax=Rhodovulum adriaticum TaxID=35804 RepID=A0A4V2SL15_RHOAD|nr:UbiH/UbiF family hydroxylase [Rhodovulum adriaticum]MBK1634705.1 2-octaprenyl-6-methoxyphenyl hydroxylase [Rhodovulum adriaticum]TCP21586.1 2-octaprenyl-6-methoxyphenol hydroxylase [Rhodovulum adriaticum]